MTVTSSKVGVWNRALMRIGETQFIEDEDEDTPSAEVCRLIHDDIARQVLRARHWPWALRYSEPTEVSELSTSYTGDNTTDEYEIVNAYRSTSQITVEKDTGSGYTTLTVTTDYTINTVASDDTPVAPFVTLVAGNLGTGHILRITVETTRPGWDYLYSLPSDCVTPIALLYESTRYMLTPVENRIPFAVLPNDAGDGHLLCCDVSDDDFEALEYIGTMDTLSAWPREAIDALAWRLAAELALAIKKDDAKYRAIMHPVMGDYVLALSEAMANAINERHESPLETPSITARG